jgi:putative DNA primase/helicase
LTVSSKHDKHRIDIAVGGAHRGKVANKTTTLRKLREQLSDPLVDKSISYAQYQALSVDEKGERKAMAGYIMPGHFTDGIRKISHQQFRSLVALDLDNVSHEQLDLIRESLVPLRRFYWFMHTTRSHCPERPRVRIFLPISRNVNAEEAYALTRLVALLLADDPDEAIEIPDLVSFRYNQIMYLPSISREPGVLDRREPERADPRRGRVPGRVPDLARHLDPAAAGGREGRPPDRSEREDGGPAREGRAHRGVLPGLHGPGGDLRVPAGHLHARATPRPRNATPTPWAPPRTAGVVYDDGLFFHSHHGSDPAEGLHNAWDLVRIHLFGHLDKDAHGNTSPANMPSFKAMREFAEKDTRTIVELSSNMLDAFDDLEDEEDEDEDEDQEADDPEDHKATKMIPEDRYRPGHRRSRGRGAEEAKKKAKKEKVDLSWTAGFRRKANGDVEPVLHNVGADLQNDPRIARCIAYNELSLDPVALKPIKGKGLDPGFCRRSIASEGFRKWTDGDDISIRRICSAPQDQGGWEFDPRAATIEEAVLLAGQQKRSFHPIRDRILEFHARLDRCRSPDRADRHPAAALPQLPG